MVSVIKIVFFQTWGLFLGEFLAMTAFWFIKLYRWRKMTTTKTTAKDSTDLTHSTKPDENANLSANLELAKDDVPPVRPTFSPFWLLPPAILDLVQLY